MVIAAFPCKNGNKNNTKNGSNEYDSVKETTIYTHESNITKLPKVYTSSSLVKIDFISIK